MMKDIPSDRSYPTIQYVLSFTESDTTAPRSSASPAAAEGTYMMDVECWAHEGHVEIATRSKVSPDLIDVGRLFEQLHAVFSQLYGTTETVLKDRNSITQTDLKSI
jgi:hypothetical protein